jgi:rubrerythrin
MDADIQAAVAALNLAIQTEREGHQFYLEAARKTQDPKGKDLFSALADDEILHEQILIARRDTLEREGTWEAATDQAAATAGNLPERGIPIFSRDKIRKNVNAYTYELSALRMATLIEKDAVAFYTRAAEATPDPQGRAMFWELADMERLHQDILENEYNALFDQFKLQMGFAPF